MSIEKDGSYGNWGPTFSLSCDECGESADGFGDFNEAVEFKKEYGWKSVKEYGEWKDLCPACVKRRNEEIKNSNPYLRNRD